VFCTQAHVTVLPRLGASRAAWTVLMILRSCAAA
jgi:hypothetical protein